MAAVLAALLVGLLVMGLSFASAQTATPAATGTAGASTSMPTVAALSTALATAIGTASPTGAATIMAIGTASPTGAATTAATTAVATTAVATIAVAPSAGTPSPTRAATAAAAGAAVSASLQISLPQQSFVPLNLALQAANAALAECTRQGYRVAVTVVDQAGNEKVVLKADGAGTHTLGSSFKKAFTAASLGSATSALVTRWQGDPTLASLSGMDDRIILLAGGLPIRVNNQVVGGIGVGGAPSGTFDEACAQAGLNSLR